MEQYADDVSASMCLSKSIGYNDWGSKCSPFNLAAEGETDGKERRKEKCI